MFILGREEAAAVNRGSQLARLDYEKGRRRKRQREMERRNGAEPRRREVRDSATADTLDSR